MQQDSMRISSMWLRRTGLALGSLAAFMTIVLAIIELTTNNGMAVAWGVNIRDPWLAVALGGMIVGSMLGWLNEIGGGSIMVACSTGYIAFESALGSMWYFRLVPVVVFVAGMSLLYCKWLCPEE